MSDKVGLVAHGDEESVYLSGKKKDEIEGEIKSCVACSIGLPWKADGADS